MLYNLVYCDQIKVNLLGGIRYVDLAEKLDIGSNTILANAADPNNPISSIVVDHFHTHNQFLGGQVGVESELRRGRYFVDLDAKVAVGYDHERTTIDGIHYARRGNHLGISRRVIGAGNNSGHSTRTIRLRPGGPH